MKQVCLFCERSAPDNNLYCQEIYCPAEMSPNILDYGEWLGDIEIVRAVAVLRSAVLYEANHQKKQVYLKVAHPGPENKERLKREAEFLANLKNSNDLPSLLPDILPPYWGSSLKSDAYGKAMLGGHLLYFYLFEFSEGDPLRDALTKRPQLWINHAGWIMISLSQAISFLHSKGIYHFALTPESVLVYFDEETNAPRVILHDLGVTSSASEIGRNWYPLAVLPAYTAPELLGSGAQLSPSTDVYGLGLILYEMLVGEPTFTFKLRNDEEIYQAIMRKRRVRMNRIEDVKNVADIALQAVSSQPAKRQQNAQILEGQLKSYFGDVPPEKKSRIPSLNSIFVVIGALLAIAFLITLAISLNEIVFG